MGEVLIEGRRLDVKEGLDFSFNYSIADVRDPNKRSTEYSKTIQCPGTPSNDELFGNIWDVNISNSHDSTGLNVDANFNPNKKAEARVISDGVEVMVGVVQLRGITILNGKLDYEVVFIGNLISFFSVINKSKLRSIDFSDLDHTYDRSTISLSWLNSEGYTYPMIDYGDDFDSDNGMKVWRVRQFRPALFVKTIWDRIFDFAGFTYTSSFLDSSPFDNLIVPFSGEKLYANDAQISSRKFQASQSLVDGAYSSSDFNPINANIDYRTLRIDDDSTGENFDPGNNWSTSSWRYLVPNSGYYKFNVNQSINAKRTTVNANRVYGGVINVSLQVIKADTASNTTIIGESTQAFSFIGNPSSFDITLDLAASCEEQLMLTGEKVQFRFLINWTDFVSANLSGQTIPRTNLFSDFDITTQSSVGRGNPSATIFEGDTLTFQSTVPDVVIIDFVMSIVKMFNLYITIDPLNEKNLIIETRDEFYAAGTTRDWNKKLARDRKTSVQPLGLLSAKVYEYKYKEDNDYYNTRFQNTYLESYGARSVDIENDFLSNKKEVEVVFSPTPSQIDGNSNRFVSRIYDNDISEGAKPTESNIRILYYYRKICNPNWIFKSELTGGALPLSIYPYAGNLDDSIAPTLDLNFGIPDELFYQANGYTGTLQYTNANLFNVYHRKFIDEITDKDSKVLKGEFYLTPWDISKLDFRDQIIVDNAYWRINKISDYNPFKDNLTKVELIKVLDVVEQPVEVFDVGSIGETENGEQKPHTDKPSKRLSQFNNYSGKVTGRHNIVSPNAQDFKVLGDGNFIGDSSKNITITGNNNYVSGGLKNIFIINSDNQEVYTSDTTIVNGVTNKTWVEVEVLADYTAVDRNVVLSSASVGAFTVTLPPREENLWVCVKKIDPSANAITVATSDSDLIDGAVTHTISSQYDAVDLYCDGKNWYIRSSN